MDPDLWVLGIIFLLLYLFQLLHGIYRIHLRSTHYLTSLLLPCLHSQFHQTLTLLPPLSLNSTSLHSSGRRNCAGCETTLTLRPTHDLLHLWSKQEERFCLKVYFACAVEPLVCALWVDVLGKMLWDRFPEVKVLAEEMSLGYLPSSLVFLAERRESGVLTKRFVEALKGTGGNRFRWLVVSDQMEFVDLPPGGMELCCAMPRDGEELRGVVELMSAFWNLIDMVAMEEVYESNEARENARAARFRIKVILAKGDLNVAAAGDGTMPTKPDHVKKQE